LNTLANKISQVYLYFFNIIIPVYW
jgi:hypothetical protein